MNNFIHAKLFATYLALAALRTFLLGGYLMWSFYIFFMKTKQADLEDWTNALSKDMQAALERNDFKQVEQLVQHHGASKIITLRVFTPDGRLLATSIPKEARQNYQWIDALIVQEALQDRTVSGVALARGAAREPELYERFIQTAQAETIRLSRLIENLLDLGRLEAGEQGVVNIQLLLPLIPSPPHPLLPSP